MNNEGFFKKLEDDGYLVDEMASLGWGFWLPNGGGYMDEHTLRILADEIERRNKPFWDEYEAHCAANPPTEDIDFSEPFEIGAKAL